MRVPVRPRWFLATLALLGALVTNDDPANNRAVAAQPANVKNVVDASIGPIMHKYGVPGMAVGLITSGKTYEFNYGSASMETRSPVTGNTLFEIGSISKTFTATLASYEQVLGALSLSAKVGDDLPVLRRTKFGDVSLLELGTHVTGGLPLQVPDRIKNDDDLIAYLKQWQPAYPPGTYRTYSNVSIGMLGFITAKSMNRDFTALMQERLFPLLGLRNAYIDVPANETGDYAQGYTPSGKPIRMTAGVLSSEAYGVRITATDLTRFAEENMRMVSLDGKAQRAITETHTGYFRAGGMTQDLIWEQYPYPVKLTTLLEGNSSHMLLDATPVRAIVPAEKPRGDVWIDKTGTTNGFGAYVAFVPERRLGIVILANKNYPIKARVTLAYRILTQLSREP